MRSVGRITRDRVLAYHGLGSGSRICVCFLCMDREIYVRWEDNGGRYDATAQASYGLWCLSNDDDEHHVGLSIVCNLLGRSKVVM